LRDLKEFPGEVRRMVGFALFQAQMGRKHPDAKVLKGFGGSGVLEVVSDHDGDTFLMRGKLDGFSMDRLFRFLNALGRDVEIVIRPARQGEEADTHVVSA
jgi:hypothetical protein